MTREKAIEILKEMIEEGWLISDMEKCTAIDACEMAIKALEKESKSEWQHDHEILRAYSDGAENVLDNLYADIQKLRGCSCSNSDGIIDDIEDIIDNYKTESNNSEIPTGSTTKKDCNTCTHNNETDGSNCYECVKGICNNYEPTTKNDLGVDCISRAEVNRVIEDYRDEQYHVLSDRTKERAFGAKAVMARINELPSVTPIRPKGHWIDHSDEGYVECPKCGSATNCDDNIADLHFCFSCGADMREVVEE